ncbi:hypothetical protein RSOLAG22IIIB_11182 [Rhizoctonia solani]|uniref:Inhibitor I9 domain-containing protein n=1 Tax=Rhizoctonia solani TaxID=456999 RepID=A0A0K6G6Y4_9AGAM|nr:unnamed protein product [Rhizoctonia solani]CUA74388.1 hypothetical protein RSOLAG22IIIB_11182 [Rhizoctonia solani]
MNQNPFLVAKPQTVPGAIADTYIVTLKPDVDLKSHVESVQKQISKHSEPYHCEVVRKYDLLGGYEVKLSEAALDDLRKRSDVKTIVQDREGSLDDDILD